VLALKGVVTKADSGGGAGVSLGACGSSMTAYTLAGLPKNNEMGNGGLATRQSQP
jgi:hypothetical protein